MWPFNKLCNHPYSVAKYLGKVYTGRESSNPEDMDVALVGHLVKYTDIVIVIVIVIVRPIQMEENLCLT